MNLRIIKQNYTCISKISIQSILIIFASRKGLSGLPKLAQWLRLNTYIAGDVVLIPGYGTKIPHAARHSQKIEKKKKKTNLKKQKRSFQA